MTEIELAKEMARVGLEIPFEEIRPHVQREIIAMARVAIAIFSTMRGDANKLPIVSYSKVESGFAPFNQREGAANGSST
jgi:hypothetical protein